MTSAASQKPMLGAWLLVCAGLVWAMVALGGVTRLTRSGLSIVHWEPITGVLPPIGEAAWLRELAAYRDTPEGRMLRPSVDLPDFRQIYWIEWSHRLLGRITGLLLLGPFAALLVRRRLSGRLARWLALLVALGGLQGFAGWYMVKSGLTDFPQVSPLRLMIHFVLALLIFAGLLWPALELLQPRTTSQQRVRYPPRAAFTVGLLLMLGLTMAQGALVAGHHAGALFPSFPDMNGQFWPEPLHGQLSRPAVFVSTPAGVHFLHRAEALLCSVLALLVITTALRRGTSAERRRALLVASLLSAQVALGAFTVLRHVPLLLASLHQVNAMALFAGVLGLLHRQGRKAEPKR